MHRYGIFEIPSRASNILPIRNYGFNVVYYSLKRNIFPDVRRTVSTRRDRFVLPFTPHSTRLEQSFDVHLVKLLNNIPRDIQGWLLIGSQN